MQAEYVRAWLLAFTLTSVIEVPIYRRYLACSRLRAFAASALTHPVLWFVLFPLLTCPRTEKVALAELFAWSAEACWFAPTYGWRAALLGSLVANASSYAFGSVLRELFGAF